MAAKGYRTRKTCPNQYHLGRAKRRMWMKEGWLHCPASPLCPEKPRKGQKLERQEATKAAA